LLTVCVAAAGFVGEPSTSSQPVPAQRNYKVSNRKHQGKKWFTDLSVFPLQLPAHYYSRLL